MTTPNVIRVAGVLKQIEYKPGWNWLLGGIHSDDQRVTIQVAFPAQCRVTGKPTVQHGRKWLISPHATKSEIVQTALKAVLAAEEHEAREAFLYRGQAIFGPHFDVDALYELSIFAKLDARTPPESEVRP